MDFLDRIMALKRGRLETARGIRPVEKLRERAMEVRAASKPHRLRTALQAPGINIIAEIKRASPSLGLIRPDLEPKNYARIYEQHGAAAVSVLTEEDMFLGSLDDLGKVRESVEIPVLRKDFIFDEYQLYEAAEYGADALLLIVAALNDQELVRLRLQTEETLQMDALVEVHTADELQRALDSGATMIGVNNRDLRSFEVTLNVSLELANYLPGSVISVSESGLRSADDLKRLHDVGFNGFLIGEGLMRAQHAGDALLALTGRSAETF
jgi:indole-3-glycerol phosphate synthase